MKNKIAIFLLSTASLSSAFGAQIYNNGSFNSLGGNAMGDFLESDDFTWPTLTTFSGFTFFTLEANGTYLGSVTWSIRANSAGQPGSTVLSGNVAPARTNVGSGVGGLTVFQNDVAVASTSLAAGTYWLVLHDGLSSNTDFQDFYFAWTNVNPTNTASTRGKEQSLVPASVTWDATGQEHAFFISGTSSATPEPGSILLLSGGLAVLLLARKRVSA